jgi:HEAT repeat protein
MKCDGFRPAGSGHRLNRRTAWHLCCAVVAAFVLVPCAAPAQVSSQSIRNRYDKATKGATIDDYVRNLGSEDADKRLQAVKSLGASKDSKAVEHLIGALGDPDMRVQAKSVDLLGELRATDATQVLIQHLFLRNTEPLLKQRILASLGKIGDVRAARPIMEFLQRDLDSATRGTAIYALGDIGAPESVETLQTIAVKDRDPTLRRLANEAAQKVQHQQDAMRREVKGPSQTFLPQAPPPQEP